MKLNITFEHDPETGKEHTLITDDRGERMPCVRAVTVRKEVDEASLVTIELIVDQSNVTLGSPRLRTLVASGKYTNPADLRPVTICVEGGGDAPSGTHGGGGTSSGSHP